MKESERILFLIYYIEFHMHTYIYQIYIDIHMHKDIKTSIYVIHIHTH